MTLIEKIGIKPNTLLLKFAIGEKWPMHIVNIVHI